MTAATLRAHRLFAVAWAVIFLVALFIVVTSLVDRCSRHEDAWARQTTDMGSGKVSKGD
jgi:hypothetical protein